MNRATLAVLANTTATWKGSTEVAGIFDAPNADAFAAVEDTSPSLLCLADDVVGVAHGDAIAIGASSYKVRAIDPDGSGMVRLALTES